MLIDFNYMKKNSQHIINPIHIIINDKMKLCFCCSGKEYNLQDNNNNNNKYSEPQKMLRGH